MAQLVKNPPAMWETLVPSLGWEDPLEEGMATHSSTLALKIPWAEELGSGYYPWGHKESYMTEQLSLSYFFILNSIKKWKNYFSISVNSAKKKLQQFSYSKICHIKEYNLKSKIY